MTRRRRPHLFLLGAAVAQLLSPAASLAAPAAASASMPPERAGFERMIEQSSARVASVAGRPEVRGSGPYPATMEVDLALPNATVYRPAELSHLGKQRLGILIWGNGGCSNDGASARKHLAEIASHGYLVIAPGKPLTGPLTLPGAPAPEQMRTTIQDLRGLLDWAMAENGRRGSPYHQRLDPAAVAAAGHSCGGMQAILLADDPRVKTLIVHNSGVVPILPDNPPLVMHQERLQGVVQPTLIVLGGQRDVIWRYGLNSFERMTSVPVVLLSREDGHGGTFDEEHGGIVARYAVDWLQWRLRGRPAAKKTFSGPTCSICRDPTWVITKRGIR